MARQPRPPPPTDGRVVPLSPGLSSQPGFRHPTAVSYHEQPGSRRYKALVVKLPSTAPKAYRLMARIMRAAVHDGCIVLQPALKPRVSPTASTTSGTPLSPGQPLPGPLLPSPCAVPATRHRRRRSATSTPPKKGTRRCSRGWQHSRSLLQAGAADEEIHDECYPKGGDPTVVVR